MKKLGLAALAVTMILQTLSVVAKSLPIDRRAEAEGCLASTLSCGSVGSGQIAPGDCAFSDGTRYDVWHFAGTAGEIVQITLSPIDATLTNGTLFLEPPAGDASKVPVALGPGIVKVFYALSSTGTWSAVVSSPDLFAAGRYTIALACLGTNPADNPQNCISQLLLCGQSGDWFLTATSCQFTDSAEPYADYNLGTFRAGDTVRLTGHSDDFNPTIAIYKTSGDSYLAYANGSRFGPDANLIYTIPSNDAYDFIITSEAPTGGEFIVEESCVAAPCFATAIITSEPSDTRTQKGSQGTLSVQASGNGPLFYQWYEGQNGDTSEPVSIDGGSSTLSVLDIITPRTFWVRITNDCAQVDSSAATITPFVPPHLRIVRH